MSDPILLAGSLSNDLMRVASLAHRGSDRAAKRFLQEAKVWSEQLAQQQTNEYIKKIATNISARRDDDISLASAEYYLMCAVLLQNYCLHASRQK